MRGGNDLDVVAVVQFGAQRRQFVIDFHRYATIADIGMYGIGKIHRCRAFGQRQNLAFGRKHVDFVRE